MSCICPFDSSNMLNYHRRWSIVDKGLFPTLWTPITAFRKIPTVKVLKMSKGSTCSAGILKLVHFFNSCRFNTGNYEDSGRPLLTNEYWIQGHRAYISWVNHGKNLYLGATCSNLLFGIYFNSEKQCFRFNTCGYLSGISGLSSLWSLNSAVSRRVQALKSVCLKVMTNSHVGGIGATASSLDVTFWGHSIKIEMTNICTAIYRV